MKSIIKSFFFSKGKFQPVYFWITVLMILVMAMVIMRLCNHKGIDNTLVIGVLGFVAAWVALYNFNRNTNGGNPQ